MRQSLEGADAAEGRGPAGIGVEEILHRDRYAGERSDVFTPGDAFLKALGGGQGAFGIDVDKGVEGRVACLDAVKRRADAFCRGEILGAHPSRNL